ncbi:hypothetical protein ACHAXA_004175 [Cyclostephanos tholiformis]|uniref:UDENN domain-containing protein n=1 Tax=Cyclostephanos tholiformis TaxID=382380 RepID=A0ABD3RBJ9_9STRA
MSTRLGGGMEGGGGVVVIGGNATSRLLASLPPNCVRSSTSKVMPHRARGRGNGAEWDEEYRWDMKMGCSPMEGCLLVQLNTRLGPTPVAGDQRRRGKMGARGRDEGMAGAGGGDAPSSSTVLGWGGIGGSGSDSAAESAGLGLRGLWRKGREQLGEHAARRRVLVSTNVAGVGPGPREQSAAAVAQYLMGGGGGGVAGGQDDDDARTYTATTTSLESSQHSSAARGGGGGDGGVLNQQDLVDYHRRSNESIGKSGGGGGGAMGGGGWGVGVIRTVRSEGDANDAAGGDDDEEDDHAAEGGVCLGTLTIPLSRLPLEDAFLGKDASVVEQWYQLDDPGRESTRMNSLGAEGNEANGGTAVAEDVYDDDDDEEEPTLIKGPRRCPSVLLEITFASSDYLDYLEDIDVMKSRDNDADDRRSLDLEHARKEAETPSLTTPVQSSQQSLPEPKNEAKSKKKEEPELEPGIIDYVCILGARDIGNQRHDDGSKGWVQSTPECCVLERFPPTDDFHVNCGRNVGLVPQIEWFTFPEGCKLWRGHDAPTPAELVGGGVSIASSTTNAMAYGEHLPTKFDIALGTTCSFSWFVLSSNSDVYGSRLVKTYVVVVRFYVPAPKGIDPTQDDFASLGANNGGDGNQRDKIGNKKRLWIPIGICLTTTLPIVGIVEEILLRMCNAMVSQFAVTDDGGSFTTSALTKSSTSNDSSTISSSSITSELHTMLQKDLYHLIVNFSKPMDGIVHCSIPFLDGERLHVTTTPPNGLPPLPHGAAVSATCRLLGAEGLTLLLAAALTECRILIHSTNVAHVAMVAEVITALIFPFTWQLPYIPVLPKDMLEILDAPLPFFVGVPTVSLNHVDKSILSEVVVVDLDDIASFTKYDARRGPRTKVPPALPASVSMSISQAVKVLLKEEDELEEYMNTAFFPGLRRSPRLEMEDLPERMFRINVALQICSLIRGYQECLFFVSALQPVFNRDRFLRQAPALFEDKRPSSLVGSTFVDRAQKILSPRSKRFLSVLVNSQHFHHLLERLNSEESAFFHEVMEAIEGDEEMTTGLKNNLTTTFGSTSCEEAAQKLFESLENIERKLPTFVVNRPGKPRRDTEALWTWDDSDEDFKIDPYVKSNEPFWLLPEEKAPSIPFTHTILQPILVGSTNDPASSSGEAGVHTLSLEYLVELEKNPWRYRNMIEIPVHGVDEAGSDGTQDDPQSSALRVLPRVKLCEAIGENNFRAWKIANDHNEEEEELNIKTPTIKQIENDEFDLSGVLLNISELPLEKNRSRGFESTQPRVDSTDRERVRRCLEKLVYSGQESINDDLVADAELALRNPSAQRYLFSVLTSSVQRRKRSQEENKQRQSVTRLEPNAFEGIVRLCYAVLEACTEEQNYESAYRLLTCTGGFCTSTSTTSTQPELRLSFTSPEQKTIYMTERINIHPIFADLRLWERVLLIHQQEQQNSVHKEDMSENEEGEDSTLDDVTNDNEDIADNDAHNSVVTTLYEMVGYNVPAEEVSRFATRVSEEKGWFATERGQSLLVLARRLTAKRDEGEVEKSSRDGEFTTSSFVRKDSVPSKDFGAGGIVDEAIFEYDEIAWAHPASCLVTYERQSGARTFLGNMLSGPTESPIVGSGSSHGVHKNSNKKGILDANAGDYAGRVAITALASFGGSAVVTGGIDGSVFLAHTINLGADSISRSVYGVQLQWGEEGRDSSSGSVTCIAASKGSGHKFGGGADKSASKSDDDEIIASMDGCQIIAGTADGTLRAWSLKDVYSASRTAHRDNGLGNSPSQLPNRSHHGSGATSVRLYGDDSGMQETLAGFPVGGHRGGVTCIDLPPRMYRPDSLVSGGEDGLIKIWSLKTSSIDQGGGAKKKSIKSRLVQSHQMTSITDFDEADAQGVLTGHEGKIICIKTAWHGDKLLSGGADKTVRLWDLVSVGKPLMTFRGHQGWVTETHFWGTNTIVSASTDRSIHVWDTRAGSSPIFALRYHLSPVSDLLLGNRSEPLLVSAGADGSLATWDVRVLSGTRQESSSESKSNKDGSLSSRTMRSPMAAMNHADQSNSSMDCGSVKLARAIGRDDFSFFSVSDDGVVNEWEASSGCKMSTHESGHKDAISGISSFSSTDGLRQNMTSGRGQVSTICGTITCSWDGTVRLRRLTRKR